MTLGHYALSDDCKKTSRKTKIDPKIVLGCIKFLGCIKLIQVIQCRLARTTKGTLLGELQWLNISNT